MGFTALTAAFMLLLLLGLVFFVELGRRAGTARLERDPEAARASTAAIDGTVYALLGLLVAFSFSGAAERFDARRRLIAEEAAAIRTAWLHVDLFPATGQEAMRQAFREYVELRLAVHRAADDEGRRALLERHAALRARIWRETLVALAAQGAPDQQVVIPPLDAMFEKAGARLFAAHVHQPIAIFALLVLLSFVASLLAGYQLAGTRRRSVVHLLVYAVALAGALTTIVDLEFPRLGLINVDRADYVMAELRASMG